ncbi:gamma-type small acid-soluble spore protein [Lysinibacillus parviboronicapiens]
MNEEFGTETDVNQVKQQIQQAEAKKIQASGRNANNGYGNNTN